MLSRSTVTLSLVVFLVVALVGFAAPCLASVIFQDDFEYEDSVTNHDWRFELSGDHLFTHTTTTLAHTGGRSLLMDSTDPNGSQRVVHQFPSPTTNVYAEAYMYDQAGNEGFNLLAAGLFPVPTAVVGVRTQADTSHDHYATQDTSLPGTWLDTTVERTTGWHKLALEVTCGGTRYYVDDQLVRTDAALRTIDHVTLVCGDTINSPEVVGTVYFDDLLVSDSYHEAVATADPATAAEGEVVALSTTEPADSTFLWRCIAGPCEGVSIEGETLQEASFVAPVLAPGLAAQTFTIGLTVGDCEETTVDVLVTNINQAPVAAVAPAGPAQDGSTVVLDGSASFDYDADPLTYTWVQTGGSETVILNPLPDPADDALISFEAPDVGPAGETYSFDLVVSDGTLDSEIASVDVEITYYNNPPAADAGCDSTADEMSTVTLDGRSSSDSDGDPIVSYTWEQTFPVGDEPEVELFAADTAEPHFEAPLVAPGGVTLTFQLTVDDPWEASEPDTVAIAVANINDPPACALAKPARGPRSARSPVSELWKPNHKMIDVGTFGVADPDEDDVTITFLGVTQDEPVAGLGGGDTAPDATILADGTLLLRAERDKKGNGRLYVIEFEAADEWESCTGSVVLCVPVKKGRPCIDDRPLVECDSIDPAPECLPQP